MPLGAVRQFLSLPRSSHRRARTHTFAPLSRFDPGPQEFLRRFFRPVDSAIAACPEHLPPLDFNPICLYTPANPSGYLLGSLAC